MIVGATVERFRGLQRLVVDGLGRVNLVIGRNDCGKTALMEALMIAGDADDAAQVLVRLAGRARSRGHMETSTVSGCRYSGITRPAGASRWPHARRTAVRSE